MRGGGNWLPFLLFPLAILLLMLAARFVAKKWQQRNKKTLLRDTEV